MAGLDVLRARIAALEGPAWEGPSWEGGGRRLALGAPELDAVLGGGLRLGRVHEISGPAADGFAVALLACGDGSVLWCRDARRDDPPYPPGLASMGLDPGRVLFVSALKPDEALWVAEEALASGAVGAVVAEPAKAVDLTASRRLQLAAEKGGGLGVVLPPSGRNGLAPNTLSTRWRVTPCPLGRAKDGDKAKDGGRAKEGGGQKTALARWHLDLLRHRGGEDGRWIVDWQGTVGHERETAHRFIVVSEAGDRPAGPGAGGSARQAAGGVRR